MKTRGHSTLILTLLIASLFGAGLLSSCSTANFDSPLSLVDSSGKHPSGWLEGHRAYALPDGEACRTCHGAMLDGGLAGVSCAQGSFGGQTCHSNGPAFHPADWLDKDNLGTDSWHATAYSNGVLIGGISCETCHTPPALDAPGGKCVLCHFDMDGSNNPGTGYVHGQISGHSDTASFDESVCVNCHATNNRFGHAPVCHNCHEPYPGEHPDGWEASSVHGAAAKASPGAATGFAFCQNCHGHDFAGGSARACSGSLPCHTVDNSLTVPHPTASRWRNEDTPTHTNTRGGNAAVCFDCHEDGANSGENPSNPPPGTAPGCTNGTLCHYNKD